jgi:hypothetical protein
MSLARPSHPYHFHADLIWWDGPFKYEKKNCEVDIKNYNIIWDKKEKKTNRKGTGNWLGRYVSPPHYIMSDLYPLSLSTPSSNSPVGEKVFEGRI